jgi:hypothetical protein
MTMEKLMHGNESNMHDIEMNQQQMVDLPMVSNNEHQKEPTDKLIDDMQDNDQVNSSSEASKTKALS